MRGRLHVNTIRGAFRALVSLFILFLGYESMVAAFRLLNKPSDRAVYEGMAVLALLCVFLPVALIRFWRTL